MSDHEKRRLLAFDRLALQQIQQEIHQRWSPVIRFLLTQRHTISRDDVLIEHYDAVLRDLESRYQGEMDVFRKSARKEEE